MSDGLVRCILAGAVAACVIALGIIAGVPEAKTLISDEFAPVKL